MDMTFWKLAACAAVVAGASADAHAKKPLAAKAPLVRPDAPPDADARGRVEIRDHKNEGRFEVQAMGLDTGVSFEVFVEDAVGAGTFTSVGLLGVEGGEFGFRMDEGEDGLPLGVADVADLVDRVVQIQDLGQIYVLGTIPDFPPKNVNKGGAWERGKVAMTRPVMTPPDDDAKGTLEVRTKKEDNRDRFTVKVQRVAAGAVVFNLFLEDAVGSDVFVDIGPMVGGDDDAKFDVDTWSGAPLPLGVFDVEELAGRALEVRGDDTFTYLETTVPEFFEGKKKKAKAKSTLTGVGGAGKVSVDSHAQAPYERISMSIQTSIQNGTVELFVEDPASNTLTFVASLATSGSGNASYKVSTKSGEPLPFGASLEDLDGMAVEIRETGGAILMAGSLSAP